MKNNQPHLFLNEIECADGNFNYNLEEHDLLLDLKVLIKEYYAATFTEDGGALILNFTNGQKFKLTLKEM